MQLLTSRVGGDEVGGLAAVEVDVDILREEEISWLVSLAAFRVFAGRGFVKHGLAASPLHGCRHCSVENADRHMRVRGRVGLLGRIRHCCCSDVSLDLENLKAVFVEQLGEPHKSVWDQLLRRDRLRRMTSVVQDAQETLWAGHGFSDHADRSRYTRALPGLVPPCFVVAYCSYLR